MDKNTGEVCIESFGHLHGVPRDYDLAIDLRDFIRDPHVSPEMRESTGRDPRVKKHVLATPGARALVDHLAGTALALLVSAPDSRSIHVGIACSGGRHRSVVTAEAVAEQVRRSGHHVRVTHHHIDRPVVRRNS